MKQRKKSKILTEGELPIMKALWEKGPLYARQIVDQYPDPKPHQNTVATILKILEEKGHVGHEAIGNAHIYHAVTPKEEVRRKSLGNLISDFFDNSYKGVVSALIGEEKLSIEELKEIIEMVEKNKENHG